MLIPYQSISAIAGLTPTCNCGRIGDLESLCSLTAIGRNLLPFFLRRYPDHELARVGDSSQAAKHVRGRAERGDAMCSIFRGQAHAWGSFSMRLNLRSRRAHRGGRRRRDEPEFRAGHRKSDWHPPQRENSDIRSRDAERRRAARAAPPSRRGAG